MRKGNFRLAIGGALLCMAGFLAAPGTAFPEMNVVEASSEGLSGNTTGNNTKNNSAENNTPQNNTTENTISRTSDRVITDDDRAEADEDMRSCTRRFIAAFALIADCQTNQDGEQNSCACFPPCHCVSPSLLS